MDKSGKVQAEWMARVHEVVDYVIDNGLYCILNVHHDTGADSDSHTSWIKADEDNYNAQKERYEYLWTQIAEEFKDYDNHLLFEGYNEMLDAQSTWNAPKKTTSYKGLNNYAQSFVNAVRATGGNNETRNIIVNTYAAANNDAPVKNLTIPTDICANHIAVEVHAYPNFFTWSTPATLRTIDQIKSDVDYIANNLKSQLISKGIPAIIGEWGSYGVDNGAGKTDYDVRREMFLEFCDYFVKKMKTNNIATFYWMGLSDGDYRAIPAFNQADLAETIAKAYHGSSFQGEYPEATTVTSLLVFDGEKALNWGDGITIGGSSFQMAGEGAQVLLTYKQTGGSDDIQFFYGDWSDKPKFKVDGKSYSGDFIPHSHYNTSTGSEHTTAFSFDSNTYNILTQKGLVVHGTQITLYKAELVNTTDIENVVVSDENSPIYNLAGQRVTNPSRGIYIRNGKAFFVK